MNVPLISVIMPVYNAEKYLASAITSVINQTSNNWELLIINDGSTDKSAQVVSLFKANSQIRFFEQKNKGVSAARNIGLKNMKGDYFCFLDADDTLPAKSIEARLKVFQEDPSLSFVDGQVAFIDIADDKVVRLYQPRYKGNPLKELFKLSDRCFAGLSWMIRKTETEVFMKEDVHHGEDILFFMELSRFGGLYSYTSEVVLNYHQHANSAMQNIVNLEKGYWRVYDYIRNWKEFNWILKCVYKLKVKKFMMLDYLKKREFKRAFLVLLK